MSSGFLRRTLRGARLIELGALTVMLGLALAVYMVKARASRETGDITQVETQIGDEQKRVRLLQAEAAYLEQPARLTRLAEAIGLGPTADARETTLDQLPDVARQPALTGAGSGKPTAAGKTPPASAPPAVPAPLSTPKVEAAR
ncbi:MAG TPA: cell division protein [Caulobacteraceae bacterium]|nr:cell division protein [Caulobacteraceae bacterium]